MPSTNTETESLYLEQAFLSNTELYYVPAGNVFPNIIIVEGDEFKHITNVMRHSVGDPLNITDGTGKIYRTVIKEIEKKKLAATIDDTIEYYNPCENICVCIPRLKNNDRFEFALEKCIELGITNFIVFDAQRSVAKGNKLERWQKIAVAAMKQSLRSFLPKIEYVSALDKLAGREGRFVIADQNSRFGIARLKYDENENVCLIFGPEGGLTEKEMGLFGEAEKVYLTKNRLRSETAIITAASVLTAGRQLHQ